MSGIPFHTNSSESSLFETGDFRCLWDSCAPVVGTTGVHARLATVDAGRHFALMT